ncbi:MAG: beta-propeller fold lactonase family protein [Leptospirales bacterium]|nr:beta-propeller fold lactonase family protein [Leptospirales bacterium]
MLLFTPTDPRYKRFLFAAHFGGTSSILLFRVSSTGTLTPLNPPSFSTNLIQSRNIAVDPLLQNVFVTTDQGGSNTQRYTMDRSAGVLTQSTITGQGGGSSFAVVVDPQQRYFYATDTSGNRVISYAITNASGTGISSPATGANPAAIAAENSGRFVYVGTNAGVDRFSVSANGTLANVGTTGLAGAVSSLVVNPSGTVLYAVHAGTPTIAPFTINSDGTLTALGTTAIGTAGNYAVVTPDGRFLYCVRTAGDILMFSIASNGTLSALSPSSIAVSSPVAMAMDPGGSFVHVTNATNIFTYSIGSDGGLTLVSQSVQSGMNLMGLTAPAFPEYFDPFTGKMVN